jgi:hypothetical protein
MGRTRMMGWAPRVALALALGSLNACLKDDSGSSSSSTGIGASTPLTAVWTSTATTGTGGTSDTPLSDVWIDATTVTATGAGAILPSIDEVTYGFPRQYLPPTDPNATHQIMVQSSAAAVVNPEDQLLTQINNYRLQTLANQNQQVNNQNGGLPLGGITVTAIPPSGKLRRSARAHCKHYGKLSNNHPGALPAGANAEGDALTTGTIAPGGRLPKALVTATGTNQAAFSGAAYNTATNAFNYLSNSNSFVLTATGYTYIGIGHWPQGDQEFYWNIVLGTTVNPVN